MAHELHINEQGVASFGYVGEAAWHGLGQALTQDSPIEVWKKEAGFDWRINEVPVKFNNGTDDVIFPDRIALFRGDTKAPLSIVSADYHVVQPDEVLEFFRDLVGDAGMYLETAGVLFGGKRFWAMANTNKFGVVNGNDKIKGNLLLTTSCDGTLATNAMLVSTRVVCNNTLRIAMAEDVKDRVRVTHSRQFDPKHIKDQLGLIDHSWEAFMGNVDKMAQQAIDAEKAREFVYNLIARPNLEAEEQPYTVAQTVDNILNRFRTGMGNQGKTVWDLLNGVTEYADHNTSARNKVMDNKLWGTWFGKDANLKDRAYANALELV